MDARTEGVPETAFAAEESDVDGPGEVLRCRGFTLVPAARVLLKDGAPVDIGSRAFDLFVVLIRARGLVVERAEIVRQVWPTTIVEESNLRFQVSCVRKILGGDRHLLKTVPGRGYLLAPDVDPLTAHTNCGDAVAVRGEQDLRTLLQQVLSELRGVTLPLRPDRKEP